MFSSSRPTTTQPRDLRPRPAGAFEDIPGARVRAVSVEGDPDEDRVAADGNRVAEPHSRRSVAGDQPGGLGPGTGLSLEHVRGAGQAHIPTMSRRANDDGLIALGDRESEPLVSIRIGRLNFGGLHPSPVASFGCVRRTRPSSARARPDSTKDGYATLKNERDAELASCRSIAGEHLLDFSPRVTAFLERVRLSRVVAAIVVE